MLKLGKGVKIVQENKKFCELKKREYRDGVKSEETRQGCLGEHTHSVIHNLLCRHVNM